MKRFPIFALSACVLAWAQAVPAYDGGEVKNGGTIVGEVTYDGEPPQPKKVTVNKDQDVCGAEKAAEDLIVGPGKKLANAVVSVADVQKGKSMDLPAPVLDQKGCRYAPHVLLVPAGSSVKVLNDDGILHNIHTYTHKNQPVNIAQPKFKKEVTTEFEEPEVVTVKCDTHEWMNGVIVVVEHPYYATTDEKGAFRLSDVPPGDHTLKVWHEKLGEKSQKVKVEPGKEVRVELKLGAK